MHRPGSATGVLLSDGTAVGEGVGVDEGTGVPEELEELVDGVLGELVAADGGVLPPDDDDPAVVVDPVQPASAITAAAAAADTASAFACPLVPINPDLPDRLPESISAAGIGRIMFRIVIFDGPDGHLASSVTGPEPSPAVPGRSAAPG